MKKLGIGCGIIALVLVVGGAIGVYYVAHKVGSAVAGVTALSSIPNIERQVQDTRPYAPPASGEFTDAQLSRLLAVQAAVKDKLGTRFQAMDAKYRALSDRLNKHDATVADAPAILGAYADLAATYIEAKKSQVEAINAQHLSMAEYRWVRKQAYAAMGLPVMDFDIGSAVSDVKAGRNPPPPEMDVVVGPTGPEQNQKLVEPHTQTLEDNVSLAFLGL